MPKKNKTLCVDDLRHAEYYGMQPVFDELYHRSLEGENFTDLMDLILSRDNILLAYRNIKANGGSYTAGTDNKNISDIGCLPPETVAEKVRFIVTGSQHGYRPKPVRRKDIPKPNGKTRPLGIPCIWDRLVQQCIKQVIEPICEAKFSDNSYGFRPNRSVEHAVQKTYTMLQRMNLHYVIEFDIKGFFDNVNHSKLMRQIWAMGIHDKQLIFIIKRILKAPIRMPDGTTLIPDKGTPQGGIISPLLANIVLNELDKWVESQWQNHPLVKEYGYERKIRNSITFDRSKAFLKMRKTGLKEMYIVRYADDFRIFCRNKEDALRTKEAVTAWITERLRLEVSPEKTRIAGLLFMILSGMFSSCSAMFQGGTQIILGTSFTAKEEDIIGADNDYKALEAALRNKINNIERTHSGYDEYRYDLDEINHNPYELAAYLTVKFEDYTRDEVQATLQWLFEQQYELTLTEVVEIRTRTTSSTDPETGETTTEEEDYEYYILNVKLRNKGLNSVISNSGLSEDDMERYRILLQTRGNRPDIFGNDIYATPGGEYTDYDIPGEALTDTRFANMIREAEKYLGYPYVWGGSSPSTSFDCSGFVSYVINHCGNGWSVGRLTANGLMGVCDIIPKSSAKPGDLIFFQGTYDTSGASHVGIYVGNGMMIHCGNPISYASIESNYWQQHFYCFGRIRN